MRNIIEWLKNHSPLDYLLVGLLILLVSLVIKLPSVISANSTNQAQLTAVIKEFDKEWSTRETSKKKASDKEKPQKQFQADSTDQLLSNFITAQNALIATYYSESAKNNNTLDTTSNVAYNEKLQAFKQPLTPHLSGGASGMVLQDSQLKQAYTLSTTKLTPLGKQRYTGVFKADIGGKVFAIVTYTYDSTSNTIGNLVVYDQPDIVKDLRGFK